MEDKSAKVVRRLKALGLVPRDRPIRLLAHLSPSDTIRWTAVDAVTGEPFSVGGTEGATLMLPYEWDITEKDGWKIVTRGSKRPPAARNDRGPHPGL